MNIRYFSIVLFVGVGALVALSKFPLPTRTTLNGNPLLCHDAAMTAQVKLDHLSGPVDVALFGNSRILAASADLINRPDLRISNMGVGGTSFRQSVVLAESVARRAKPRLMILS